MNILFSYISIIEEFQTADWQFPVLSFGGALKKCACYSKQALTSTSNPPETAAKTASNAFFKNNNPNAARGNRYHDSQGSQTLKPHDNDAKR